MAGDSLGEKAEKKKKERRKVRNGRSSAPRFHQCELHPARNLEPGMENAKRGRIPITAIRFITV